MLEDHLTCIQTDAGDYTSFISRLMAEPAYSGLPLDAIRQEMHALHQAIREWKDEYDARIPELTADKLVNALHRAKAFCTQAAAQYQPSEEFHQLLHTQSPLTLDSYMEGISKFPAKCDLMLEKLQHFPEIWQRLQNTQYPAQPVPPEELSLNASGDMPADSTIPYISREHALNAWHVARFIEAIRRETPPASKGGWSARIITSEGDAIPAPHARKTQKKGRGEDDGGGKSA